ncbi:proline-rich protein 36-like [Paramacrobiotus metropolitanus]|uniref:proline-rich protein 36-like n=1 Tax=Paramacrobiotus metropolitanus TaxID=2943436 RepID=UPI00244562FA|nr:proline-rich protein 36-like [Paramacrobiotus metropolitanus]
MIISVCLAMAPPGRKSSGLGSIGVLFIIVIVVLEVLCVKNVCGLRHVQSLLESQYQDWPHSRVRRQLNTDALRTMFKAPCFGRVGFFEDPFSCSHYYHCMANGTHVRRTCIPPLQFSEERQMCMDPGTVDCPDIPDFWLAAAAAAAANSAPSPASPPSHPNPALGPPMPSSPPAPAPNNPFVSSPLSFNAPLTQPQPPTGQAQFNTHHAQASQQWNNQYPGPAPSPSFFEQNRPFPGSRASPADPNPLLHAQPPPPQPPPPAVIGPQTPTGSNGAVQMRPLTAGPYSAPLRAGFIPHYGAQVNTATAPVQAADINQIWYKMDPQGDNVLPVPQAQIPQRRFATPNSLLDIQRLQSQQHQQLQPQQHQAHQALPQQPSQQHLNAMNVLSLLNAQLGLDQQQQPQQPSPAVYAQPSVNHGQEMMRPAPAPQMQQFEPSYTVLNDAAPLRSIDAPGDTGINLAGKVTTAPAAALSKDVVSITCKPGEKGFFADVSLFCRGYYFCSPFGDRAEFSCPSGRYFNEKTVSCESIDKSSCAELARDQHVHTKSDTTDQPVPPVPTAAAQATAAAPHPGHPIEPARPPPASGPETSGVLYQLGNPEPPAPPTAMAVDPTRASLWKFPTAMQTLQAEAPTPVAHPQKPEVVQELAPLAPIDPLPMDLVGVIAVGPTTTKQLTDISDTTPPLPSTVTVPVPSDPPIRPADPFLVQLPATSAALENRLRSWNMANFSAPPASDATIAPAAAVGGSLSATASPGFGPMPALGAPFIGSLSAPLGGSLPVPVSGHLSAPAGGSLSAPVGGPLTSPGGGSLSSPAESALSAPAGGPLTASASEVIPADTTAALFNAVKSPGMPVGPLDVIKEMQDKEATALSMALAFLRAREMLSTAPPLRPLRFVDARRTVNLKLLAELLKGK